MDKQVYTLFAVLATFIGHVSSTNCLDTWVAFDGSCYLFGHKAPMDFYEAGVFCNHHGGHLVHIDNALENAFLKDTVRRNYNGEQFWIGLTDERIEGIWEWYDDNKPATFTDWNHWITNEPNGGYGENCVELQSGMDYRWNDRDCRNLNEPICEFEPLVVVG